MDSLYQAPDDIDIKLYVQSENRNIKSWGAFGEEYKLEYRGYRKDYLAHNLSELEQEFIICPTCKGIMRDATSSERETTCALCSKSRFNNPVNQVRNFVIKLDIKCPLLRNCGWQGKLAEAEAHLENCNNFRIWCPLDCGSVMKRCESGKHANNECQLRISKCEDCGISLKYKELVSHSEDCFASPIECGCGNKCRRDMISAHLNNECPLAQIKCPYAKYGCKVGVLARKDLLSHKKDFYIEHQDMSLIKIEEQEKLLVKFSSGTSQSNKNSTFDFAEKLLPESNDPYTKRINELEKQYTKLGKENSDLKSELNILKSELRIKKDLEGTEWKIEVGELTFSQNIEGPVFYIHSYKFQFSLKVGVPYEFYLMRLNGVSKASDKDETYIHEIRLMLGNNEFDKTSYYQEIWPEFKAVIGKTSKPIFTLSHELFPKHAQPNRIVTIFMYFDLRNYAIKGLF